MRTPAGDDRRPIVCFGDSLTEGWGADPEESYPACLERALGLPVVNAGWRGDRAVDALDRLEQQVLSVRPRLVVVAFGSNEAAQGDSLDAARGGIGRILEVLTERGIPALLVGVRIPEYGDRFDAALQSLAATHGSGLLLGALDGILEDPSLRSDSEHPNAKGYAALTDRILPAVRAALARSTPA